MTYIGVNVLLFRFVQLCLHDCAHLRTHMIEHDIDIRTGDTLEWIREMRQDTYARTVSLLGIGSLLCGSPGSYFRP
jgi:hypothetical protein